MNIIVNGKEVNSLKENVYLFSVGDKRHIRVHIFNNDIKIEYHDSDDELSKEGKRCSLKDGKITEDYYIPEQPFAFELKNNKVVVSGRNQITHATKNPEEHNT